MTTGAKEDVLDPIVRALQRRDVLGALLAGDRIRLLNAPEYLQVTFDAAQLRGEFRAPELAADLGIGLRPGFVQGKWASPELPTLASMSTNLVSGQLFDRP